MSKTPTLLIILDGFGHSESEKYNAVAQAKTPHLDAWFAKYPHTLLKASGEAVGLLPDSIGTSEVGHLTIGAGRVIPESVLRIHRVIDDGSFFKNPTLVHALQKLKASGGALHLMGLLSDAGVHSHTKHLFALMKAAHEQGISKVFVHAFLDGRDVPPKSAQNYLDTVAAECKKYGARIASVHGRFFAMDRDKNWDRTEQAYKVLTKPQAHITEYPQLLAHEYSNDLFDEFIPPTQLDREGIIKSGDGVIFFNFRADRARQLTRCFLKPTTVPFSIKPLSLTFFLGMTDYDHDITNEHLLTKEPITSTLKDVLAAHHKTIFSIAETEKYAHVTYFFGGGREQPVEGELWKLIPSIKARDYVAHPEMSAPQITDTVLESLKTDPRDFYLINYANADMVGHSGNFEATVKAVECLDRELGRLFDVVVTKMHGTMYITADHGNAELMYNEAAQQPKTSHTTNPVPFLMIKEGTDKKLLPLQELSDIAPFILKEVGLAVPKSMET